VWTDVADERIASPSPLHWFPMWPTLPPSISYHIAVFFFTGGSVCYPPAHAGSSLVDFSTLKIEAKRRFTQYLHGATLQETTFFNFKLVYPSIVWGLSKHFAILLRFFPSNKYCHALGWLIRRVLRWMIVFIATYTFTQFGTTGNTALSLFYTLSFHRCAFANVLGLH
jgi:hypothetical protein